MKMLALGFSLSIVFSTALPVNGFAQVVSGDTLPTATTAPAESVEKVKDDPYAKLPKSGTLSSSQTSNASNKAFDGTFGEKDPYEDSMPAIGGSMFRKNRVDWVAKVSNNTKDEFSVSVEALQLDQRGRVLKRDSFSARLKAGESHEKVIPARSDAVNGGLKLKNWKVTKRRVEDDAQAEKE